MHAGGGEPDIFLMQNTPSPPVGEGAGGEGARDFASALHQP